MRVRERKKKSERQRKRQRKRERERRVREICTEDDSEIIYKQQMIIMNKTIVTFERPLN